MQALMNWTANSQDTERYMIPEVELMWTRMLLDSALLILDKHGILIDSAADVTISRNIRVGETYFWYSCQYLVDNRRQRAVLMWARLVAKLSVYGGNSADQLTVQHIRCANAFVNDVDLTFTAVGEQRLKNKIE